MNANGKIHGSGKAAVATDSKSKSEAHLLISRSRASKADAAIQDFLRQHGKNSVRTPGRIPEDIPKVSDWG